MAKPAEKRDKRDVDDKGDIQHRAEPWQEQRECRQQGEQEITQISTATVDIAADGGQSGIPGQERAGDAEKEETNQRAVV